jgi:lipoprotein NlpI
MISSLRIHGIHSPIAVALVGSGLLASSIAIAQTRQQIEWCENQSPTASGSKEHLFGEVITPSQQIAGCTAVIESRRQSQRNISVGYGNRSGAYRARGEYDAAIADANQAVRFDPKNDAAITSRGAAYAAKGDFDRAMDDFNKAIELDPKKALAFLGRGVAYRGKGNFDRAIEAFTAAIQINPKFYPAYEFRGVSNLGANILSKALADLNQASELHSTGIYGALFLDIANKRGNLPSRLAEATTKLNMTKWPAPVVRLFLGQMTPEAVFAAADDVGIDDKKAAACEANFFVGEILLQRSANDEAAGKFRISAEICARDSEEWWVSNMELKNLGSHP